MPALVGEVGYSTLERRGARPTLDVNGLWGGFQGEGSKTIIPAHAHAKVSCRLVAAQDPDRIFEAFKAYVEEIAPPGVTTTVRLLGGGLPSLTPIDHPATQAAARALEATFGRAPVYIREGGSIPVCASFDSILGLPVVLLGFVQPDCARPRAQRVDGPRQLRDEHPDDRPSLGRAGRPAALSGAGSVRKWYVRLGDAGTCRC